MDRLPGGSRDGARFERVFEYFLDAVTSSALPQEAGRLVDELRELEVLSCAIHARQARLTESLRQVREVEAVRECSPDAPAAVRERARARAVASTVGEVALARRISPARGRMLVGLAHTLSTELPGTAAAFAGGHITEWRALLIARETATLSREHRAVVDQEIAGDPAALARRGDRETVREAARWAARLDAASIVRRRAKAAAERRITMRPAPDAMVYLTALLPMAQGVGVYAALTRAARADLATGAVDAATGEPLGLGQAAADRLIRCVLGDPEAGEGGGAVPVPPVALRVLIPVQTLFGGGSEPAELVGHDGPPCVAPGAVVRELIAANQASGQQVWLRRLFLRPGTGELLAMDSKARLFPPGLAEFVTLRDRTCRTPWCDAPIRHLDHLVASSRGGQTTAANGQGLCVACNLRKQAPGWVSETGHGARHTTVITTPTGHRFEAIAPEPPWSGPPTDPPEDSSGRPADPPNTGERRGRAAS